MARFMTKPFTLLLVPFLGQHSDAIRAANHVSQGLQAAARSGYDEDDYKCCCLVGSNCFTGEKEDALKVSFKFYGTDYCCKRHDGPRDPILFHGGCDREADAFSLPLEELGPRVPFMVDDLRREELSDICVFKQAPKTTTTTTTTQEDEPDSQIIVRPTTTPSGSTPAPIKYDPYKHLDLTPIFRGQKYVTINDVKYGCCCRMQTNIDDITCFVRDMSQKKFYFWKSGCGGLLGDGFHSYRGLDRRAPAFGSSYRDVPHAGKCWATPVYLPSEFAAHVGIEGRQK
eukprot:TRINITY_DN48111_c0_g1_i1.p1 TRINITY_DN48111_c0_g1~~TRINITY_DN48111_c0_g1_i1.p1  ORF type:complete len:285 (-),score=46.98 TRINITY_DN48111_c0_g1_i1:52-906(-)